MKIPFGKFKNLVRLLGPLVLSSVPGGDKIAQHVDVVLGAIEEAEQMKDASGTKKKAHFLKIVAAGVQEANASGKVHLDPSAAQAIASHGADAIIATVNAVHRAPAPAVSATRDPRGNVTHGSPGD